MNANDLWLIAYGGVLGVSLFLLTLWLLDKRATRKFAKHLKNQRIEQAHETLRREAAALAHEYKIALHKEKARAIWCQTSDPDDFDKFWNDK